MLDYEKFFDAIMSMSWEKIISLSIAFLLIIIAKYLAWRKK
jgi:hypothetical protein